MNRIIKILNEIVISIQNAISFIKVLKVLKQLSKFYCNLDREKDSKLNYASFNHFPFPIPCSQQ